MQSLRELISQTASKIVIEAEPCASAEESWNLLSGALRTSIETYIPHKATKSRESAPWISKQLRKRTTCRDRAYTKNKQRGKIEDEQRFQHQPTCAERAE